MPSSVAVITPSVAGREALLAECVSSVEATGAEHIVGVDTDRVGPGLMRNLLAARTTADSLFFLDDDDLVDPDIFDVLLGFEEDVVYGWCRVDGLLNGHPWCPNMLFSDRVLRKRNFIPVSALVRRSVFESVGGFRDVPLEDWDLWLRLLDAGASFRCVPEVVWTYRLGDWQHRNQTLEGEAA